MSALPQVVLVNMTAQTLKLVDQFDFAGYAWKYTAPHLVESENGAYFLHVGGILGLGASSGGLSYATRLLFCLFTG